MSFQGGNKRLSGRPLLFLGLRENQIADRIAVDDESGYFLVFLKGDPGIGVQYFLNFFPNLLH
jgi:hypothetical protein